VKRSIMVEDISASMQAHCVMVMCTPKTSRSWP